MLWLIPLLNFFSRWVLFGAVAWKAYKTRDRAWVFLAAAFFIGALDVESYILTPLGIEVPQPARDLALVVPNFYIALLVLWGAFYLKHEKADFNHAVYFAILLVSSYVWLFLVAMGVFGDNFMAKALFPSLLFGISLAYLSCVLWRYVVSRRLPDRLFPVGLFIVGVLNLTYPFGRPVEWYSNIAFFLAALGRLFAAIGAFTFVFYPLPEPSENPKSEALPPGAYLVSDQGEIKRFLPMITGGDVIAVTRFSPSEVIGKFTPASVVFWITKVREGKVSDTPTVIAVPPTKLGILQDLIIKEIEKGYRTVYIDAFEYLVIETGFQAAFKFLLNVKDFVVSKGGTVVLMVSPQSFKEQEWKNILREFTPLGTTKSE